MSFAELASNACVVTHANFLQIYLFGKTTKALVEDLS